MAPRAFGARSLVFIGGVGSETPKAGALCIRGEMSDLCIIPARALEDESLTGTDIRVLCAIGIHTDGRTGEGCFARSRTLAAEARVARNQFFRSSAKLISAGYILRDSGKSDGRPSSYSIILDRPVINKVSHKGSAKSGSGVVRK